MHFACTKNRRFANILYNIDSTNISKTRAQYCQLMASITNRILQFKPMKKYEHWKTIYFYYYYSSQHQLLRLYNFLNTKCIRNIYKNQKTNLYQFQKDCHQDNLLFFILLPYVLIMVFIYLPSWTHKTSNSIYFKSSILEQMVLYFSNNLMIFPYMI